MRELMSRSRSRWILYVLAVSIWLGADKQFMYLTVPLPIAQTKVFKCLYVPLDPQSPQIKIKLLIPQNASFMQVKEKIASLVGTKADHVSQAHRRIGSM
jgi:hypothetical protein